MMHGRLQRGRQRLDLIGLGLRQPGFIRTALLSQNLRLGGPGGVKRRIGAHRSAVTAQSTIAIALITEQMSVFLQPAAEFGRDAQ